VSAGLAPGIDRLGTETAFSVLARAKELERRGRSVIHLEIGEPDFDTPEHIKAAAAAALAAGHTGYCPSAGIPELRTAAAAYLGASRGLEIDPEAVIVAPGAKPFLFFGVLAACGPGDRVLYPDPGFPIYESAIRWTGAEPVPLRLEEARGFALDLDELADALDGGARLVILNSPNNPTGGVQPAGDLPAIAGLLAGTDAWVLSDEVYASFLYEGSFASVTEQAGMLERTILVDSCSKTFAMTGWRCGFAAVPEALREPITRFLVNSVSCVPPFVQLAAVAALEGPRGEVDAMLAEFAARRELVVDGLNRLPGVSCHAPGGAFYAFPNVGGVPVGAEELAARLLDEAGVAVLAGTSFGTTAQSHLRLSYAASRTALAEGLERMERFLAGL
jgi:aspartate/methionine/tyrosine aminotransferase